MTTPAFGSDRAEPLPDGSIALTCAISKGWSSRRAGAQTSAEHPGTAVRWNDGIFEVLEATALPGGGTRYRLALCLTSPALSARLPSFGGHPRFPSPFF